MDKYINMILLQLSNNYKVNYTELRTYKENRIYTNFIVKLYKYMPLKDKYRCTKTIEARNKRALVLKLKELI